MQCILIIKIIIYIITKIKDFVPTKTRAAKKQLIQYILIIKIIIYIIIKIRSFVQTQKKNN